MAGMKNAPGREAGGADVIRWASAAPIPGAAPWHHLAVRGPPVPLKGNRIVPDQLPALVTADDDAIPVQEPDRIVHVIRGELAAGELLRDCDGG